MTVATAESLTGGRVCAALAAIPGASAVLRGGVVAYATEVKVRVLGVPDEVVEEHGVVSAPCAEAMARGVRLLCGSDIGGRNPGNVTCGGRLSRLIRRRMWGSGPGHCRSGRSRRPLLSSVCKFSGSRHGCSWQGVGSRE